VLAIDQYAPPHEFRLDHGDTRITRIACGEDRNIRPFATRTPRDLAPARGRDRHGALTQNGFLANFRLAGDASANHGVAKFLDATVAAAKAAKVDYELSTPRLRQAYPGLSNVADGPMRPS